MKAATCGMTLVLLTVACWGMVSPTTAPATTAVVSESPTQPLPALLPVDLPSLTTRPPANGFEYALEQSSWGVNDWPTIRLIVQCESGFDRFALGRAGEVGALQIHPTHQLSERFDLTTYEGSLAAAAVVHEEAGGSFAPWSCWGGAR